MGAGFGSLRGTWCANALQALEKMIPTLGEICQGSTDWARGRKGDMHNMLKQASSQHRAAIAIHLPDLFPIGSQNHGHGHT